MGKPLAALILLSWGPAVAGPCLLLRRRGKSPSPHQEDTGDSKCPDPEREKGYVIAHMTAVQTLQEHQWPDGWFAWGLKAFAEQM